MRKAARQVKIFVISAPSGCGKTTLCKKLLDDDLGLAPSISMTTRPPREGERDGIDYHFVTRREFERIKRSGGFLEHEENFGNLYGTPKAPVDRALSKGSDVLLSIDVKGAMKVRRLYPLQSVLIFIVPPSINELSNRLKDRMLDKNEEIERRIRLAEQEMSYKDKYDHSIINDELSQAYRELKDIISSKIDKRGASCRTCL